MNKCGTCQLPGGDTNFHVCVDLSYRAPGEGLLNPNRQAAKQHSELHRARLSEAASRVWARRRQQQSRG